MYFSIQNPSSDIVLLFHSDFKISRILEIAFAILLTSLVLEAYVIVDNNNFIVHKDTEICTCI